MIDQQENANRCSTSALIAIHERMIFYNGMEQCSRLEKQAWMQILFIKRSLRTGYS